MQIMEKIPLKNGEISIVFSHRRQPALSTPLRLRFIFLLIIMHLHFGIIAG